MYFQASYQMLTFFMIIHCCHCAFAYLVKMCVWWEVGVVVTDWKCILKDYGNCEGKQGFVCVTYCLWYVSFSKEHITHSCLGAALSWSVLWWIRSLFQQHWLRTNNTPWLEHQCIAGHHVLYTHIYTLIYTTYTDKGIYVQSDWEETLCIVR